MAANGAPGTPDLPDAVNRPPPGVVLPPKDIRSIIERTAGFVDRNGRSFEDRIRDREQSNPKFSFLNENDAYSPFYTWRLNEIKEGRGTDLSAGRAGGAAGATPAAPEKPKGPEPPPEFHFSARMPNISAQDLDVVKLTALFVARNGRSFMTTLSQREARNYQFDFLRPQHSLHQFFSRLVDQYTDLLQAQTVDNGRIHAERMRELEENMRNKFHVLDKAKKRAEWVKHQEMQKVQKVEEEEKEKLEYAQIDWHDFVVVETVLFTDADDQAELPPPTSLNDLMNASLEQKAAMSLAPHNMRIEEAFPTEDMNAYYNPQTQQPPPQFPHHPPASASPYNGNGFGPPPTRSPYAHAPGQSPQPPGLPPPPAFAQAADEDEARAIAERTAQREQVAAAQAAARGQTGAPMRIRSDYVPRAQAKRQNIATTICPNCREQIPLNEYDEHIRIELLNPQWKEQRERGQARLASSHVPVMDASKNIARAAAMTPQKRDADGSSEGDEKRRRTNQSGLPTSMNVEDQLQNIKQRFGGGS